MEGGVTTVVLGGDVDALGEQHLDDSETGV